LKAVLQSDLVDEFYQLGAQTVTEPRIKRLCKRLAESGLLNNYRMFQDLLIRIPVNDALLQCIVFDKRLYRDDTFTPRAVFLPLYVDLPCFALSSSTPIKRTSEARSRSRNEDWRLSDEEALAEAISTQAEAFFDKARTPLEFARNASKLRFDYVSSNFLDWCIAGSLAQGGQLLQSRLLLEKCMRNT
jgi:hypothetical protein